jgi:heat shock protein HslJ
MSFAPCVTLTASASHSVNALTGPADQWRHDSQWQYPIADGSPVTVNRTDPQKQLHVLDF